MRTKALDWREIANSLTDIGTKPLLVNLTPNSPTYGLPVTPQRHTNEEWRAITRRQAVPFACRRPRYQSLRRTVAGCTREAHHAGSRHAVIATPNRSPMTPANTAGSSG